MKSIIKPAALLAVICLTVTLILAGVNRLTSPTIAAAEKNATEQAAMAVFESAASCEAVSGRDGVFKVFDSSGRLMGYSVSTGAKSGYSGAIISVMTGINADGTVSAVKVVSCDDETPGLGQNVQSPSFTDQFAGKSGNISVTKDGGEIEAVTSATFSSRAVAEAVSEALEIFAEEAESEGK